MSPKEETSPKGIMQHGAPSGTPQPTTSTTDFSVYPTLTPLLAIGNGSSGVSSSLSEPKSSTPLSFEPSWFNDWYTSYYSNKDWSNIDCTADVFTGKIFNGSTTIVNEFNDVFSETVIKILGADGSNPWLLANPLPTTYDNSWSATSSSSKKWDHGSDVKAFCKDWSLKPFSGVPSTSQGEQWWSKVCSVINQAQAKCPHPALLVAIMVYLVPPSLTKELKDKWLSLISSNSSASEVILLKWMSYVGTSEAQVDSWESEKQRRWALDRKLFTDFMKDTCRNLSSMLGKRFKVPDGELLSTKLMEYLATKWSTINYGVNRLNDIVTIEDQLLMSLSMLYKGDIYDIISYTSRIKVIMEMIYYPSEVMINDETILSVHQHLQEIMSYSYLTYGQSDYPKDPKDVYYQLVDLIDKTDSKISLYYMEYFKSRFYEIEKKTKENKENKKNNKNPKKNNKANSKKISTIYDNVNIKRADGSVQKIRGTFDTGSSISMVRRSIADKVSKCAPITITGIKDCTCNEKTTISAFTDGNPKEVFSFEAYVVPDDTFRDDCELVLAREISIDSQGFCKAFAKDLGK